MRSFGKGLRDVGKFEENSGSMRGGSSRGRSHSRLKRGGATVLEGSKSRRSAGATRSSRSNSKGGASSRARASIEGAMVVVRSNPMKVESPRGLRRGTRDGEA